MLSLAEQQLVVRHGFGGCNTALYSIPTAAAGQAAEIAYAEFPDDQRFVYTASCVAARVPCAVGRRHGSPRQLAGRTRGGWSRLMGRRGVQLRGRTVHGGSYCMDISDAWSSLCCTVTVNRVALFCGDISALRLINHLCSAAGVEKSSASRARSKRGLGDELAAQRQKRVRAELDSGCAPMSP